MDIPLFKVRRVGLPDFRFRMQFFNSPPCSRTHTLTVTVHIDKQKLELVAIGVRVDGENHAAYNLSIQNNVIAFRTLRFKGADHMIPWDNLLIKGTKLHNPPTVNYCEECGKVSGDAGHDAIPIFLLQTPKHPVFLTRGVPFSSQNTVSTFLPHASGE